MEDDIEKTRKQGRESYYRHRDSALKRVKKYREDNLEKISLYAKEYYQKNKEKCKMQSHLHWQKNKVRLNKTRNEFRRKLRQQAIQLLGGKCVQCGFSDFRGLAIDHIHGGGTKEARHVGTRKICHIIVTRPKEEWQDKYQCLCANCNWIKAYENEIRRVY